MRRRVILLMVFIVPICSVSRGALKGGCARVDITPPLGITLIGSKGQPSDAVMDELYAKALVLSDGDHTVALLSADLLYTPLEEITRPVRDIVESKTGIPGRNVMVCGTHTHSGPEVFTRSKVPREGRLPAEQIDRSYLGVLTDKMATAVLLAHRHMRDIRIGAAVGQLPEMVYNRRPTNADGQVEMAFTLAPEVAATRSIIEGPDGQTRATFTFPHEEKHLSFGPIDPDVFVLRMEDIGGNLVGSLVDYGCHPVCVYPFESTAVSADYPGHATRLVEQGEGGTCLFALGLAGNTVPWQRGVEPCRQMGKALGGEALRRLQRIAVSDDVTLHSCCKEVSFPTKRTASGDNEIAETITTEIQVLRLGDVYVLGLPGEVVVEVGLEIKKKAGVDNLVIVTLANDAIGYVCHAQAYEEGGYEPTSGTDLAKGAGEIMIEQALVLIEDVKRLGKQAAVVSGSPG